MNLRLLACFFLLPFCTNGQHWESGVALGTSHYLGDLAPSSLWTSLGESNLAAGIFVRYNFNDFLAARVGFTHGAISASDELSLDAGFRKNRNLSFRSDIYEMALLGEFNILGYQPAGLERTISPYIFGGIAVFKFNPQAKLGEQWYDLQPLGTEGQGLAGYPSKYALTQISIPVGLGFKVALHENFNLTFETGMRKTYTDYLDDVSNAYPDLENLAEVNGELAAQLSWRYDEIDPEAPLPQEGTGRGDPKDRDWYIFTQISFSYNFLADRLYAKGGKAKGKKSKIGCPRF